jgi:hypothetical protein
MQRISNPKSEHLRLQTRNIERNQASNITSDFNLDVTEQAGSFGRNTRLARLYKSLDAKYE